MDTIRSVFTNPTLQKSVVAGAAVGGGITLVRSGMNPGPTMAPGFGGAVSSVVTSAIFMGVVNAGFSAIMARSNHGAAALQGAKFGAAMGAGWGAGSAVVATGASAVGI
jgi:hypothetical protein